MSGNFIGRFSFFSCSFINEEFNPKIIGAAIGVYVAATPLGGLVGRILISTLTDVASWRMGLMIAGILYLLSAIMMWIFLPPSLIKKSNMVKLKYNGKIF